MSASDKTDTESASEQTPPGLRELPIDSIVPNDSNPRLDFPQQELDRLAESIDQEGILVPIVVYPRDDKFVLVDGERRFRCARELGLPSVPAVITTERSEQDVLQQMFNIHLIREPWRDIPTAVALERLASAIKEETDEEPTDNELRERTGLSVDRVRQLRYVMTLPEEWRDYIRSGEIPLNFFWELKKNVVDALRTNRPKILDEFGAEKIQRAFVKKRLDQVITDTVSLRKVAPIIRFAAQDAAERGEDESALDESIRQLILEPSGSIEEAYEDTVQMMVEVDKLGRRTSSMLAVFTRLLRQSRGTDDHETVRELGQSLVDDLSALLRLDSEHA